MKKFCSVTIKLVIVVFAFIGFGLSLAYVGVNLHWTNTDGIVDRQAEAFWESGKQNQTATLVTPVGDTFFTRENYCALKKLKEPYPGTFWRILNLALDNKKTLAQNNLSVAISNLTASSTENINCSEIFDAGVSQSDFELMAHMVDTNKLFALSSTTEWSFFKVSVVKDRDAIKKAEEATGVKSRILVSMLVAEQMRLFYSDRAWFKKAIAPAKVLASMSQFSLGVLGVKTDTAIHIENNLKDKSSEFYPGAQYERLLDFTSTNTSSERFKRLTDYHDHSYDYLYAALYSKEIIVQWQKYNIDISGRPEILATLYNIGFGHSIPNSDPQMGGAEISIAGKRYSFGRLAYDFYYSGELLEEFPQ